jgi:TRAP-type C4-dicarboxylate transport system permease small subunit
MNRRGCCASPDRLESMQKAIDLFFKLLELLVVLALVAMVFMVFGNVVLRYGFNSGILISEEMSRYFFIWLTYIGAMIAMRERGHLGVDTLVKHLPRAGKKACLFVSESLMLFVNVLFIVGTWKMHDLQATSFSPVTGLSMIWIYGMGYVVGGVMGLFNLAVLLRLASGRLSDEELVQVEAEGMPHEADAEVKA